MSRTETVDAAAFDLGSRDAGRAALCLHGLTGTPYEVRSLGAALAGAGWRASGPLLPGHGTGAAELAAVPYTDWLAAARDHADALRREHGAVAGLGVSMGGLLTLALAAEGRLDAAVVVGTPLRLRQPLAALVPVLRYLVPFPRKRGGSDIRDPEARARHPSLDVMPLAAVRELQRLQRFVRPRLGEIRIPLLVAHGAHDGTANPADARRIVESVASERCEHLVLGDSAHVVPVDRDGPRLAAASAAFLSGVC